MVNNVDLVHLIKIAKMWGNSNEDSLDWNSLRRSLGSLKKTQDELNSVKNILNKMLNNGQILPQKIFQAVNGYKKLRGKIRQLNQVSYSLQTLYCFKLIIFYFDIVAKKRRMSR